MLGKEKVSKKTSFSQKEAERLLFLNKQLSMLNLQASENTTAL